MQNEVLKKMRPCVAVVFENGAQDRNEFEKMRFAIVFELRRLDVEMAKIKMALLEWNTKNNRVLSTGDAQRQLCDFVNWFFKHDCKIGCKGLKDYCRFLNGGCVFKPAVNTEEIKLPFSLVDAMVFLEKEYRRDGYLMGKLILILFKIQKDKNAPNILYVGIREIRARLNNDERLDLDEMTLLRALNKLEEAGILKITHGKSGTFGRRTANGYSFMSWEPPAAWGTSTTHNNSVCVTV